MSHAPLHAASCGLAHESRLKNARRRRGAGRDFLGTRLVAPRIMKAIAATSGDFYSGEDAR
jgi:hypothetical protein